MFSLSMKQWMTHDDLTISAETPITFVLGKNGAGKTAIRDALEFIFLGTCELRGIGTKKELGALAVRDGAVGCEVTLTTPRLRIRRTMTRSGEQKLFRAQRASATDRFGEEITIPMKDGGHALPNLPADSLRAILDPSGFFRLPTARRRELLVAATTSKLTAQEIAQALGEIAPKARDADRLRMAEMAASLGFRKAEETAIESRRAAKRALEDEGAANAPDPMLDGIDLSKNPLQAFEKRQGELREQHRQAMDAQGAILKRRADLGAAEERMKVLLDPKQTPVPDPPTPPDLAAAKAELEAANEDRLEIERAKARAEVAQPKALPPTPPAACPVLVPAVMACPATGKAWRAAAKSIERPDPPPMVPEADVKKAIARVEAAQRAVSDAERAHAAVKAAQDRIASIEKECDELEARINGLSTAVKEDEKAEAVDLGKLMEAIERGGRIVEAKRRYDAAHDAYEKRAARREQDREAVESWDAIATALKPDGVETKLGGQAAEAFKGELERWTGLCGKIEIDPEFTITANDRHYLQLSLSQRMALGVAIQHAFARSIRFPFLLCDAFDAFDSEKRASFVECALKSRVPGDEGVIALATASEPPRKPPEFATTFWLGDEGLQQLGGSF